LKVLLVGGAGFIGKRLAVSLLKAGHDVRALFRKAQSEAPAGDFRIEWLQLDLLDPDYDLDTAIAGCSVIFNCAGELHGVERPFFRLPEMLVRAFALGGGWLKGFP
jgi:nucleoside-diphosphate-sugar epimerase